MTGSGFNPTPAGNTVRFNGVDAVVTAASTQRLVVTTPAGATTGPVSVTVGSTTVASAEDYVVTAAVPGPVLTGFSPVGGPVGTTVTLMGSNFHPDRLLNRVFFGDIQAFVVSASPSQLEVKVSNLGETGRVKVATPSGRVTSGSDFLVLPSSLVPGAADTLLQAEVGGPPSAVSLADASRRAVLSFPVSRGEQVSVVSSSVVLGGASSASLLVHDQMGAQIGSFTLSAEGGVHDLPVAPRGAVYTAVVRATGTTTGFSVSLALVRAAREVLEKDGAATTFVGQVGQNGFYDFVGTAGERLGLGVTGVAIAPSGNNVAISILKPDGNSLVDCGGFSAPGNCDVPALPVTGTYTVSVNPPRTATAEVGLLLSTSLGDSLLVDGPPATFSTSRVGQDGYYTFEAGVGSNLTLVLAGNTFATNTLVRVLRPDGTQLATQSIGSSSGYTLDFTPTTTGLHAITVDPNLASTGQLTLQLVEEVNGSAGVPDSAATTVSLGAGQKGRYAFNGTAGDRLGLGVTSVAISPSSNNVAISILKPDGTSLVSCGNFTAPGDCDLPALPVTGTYFVTVNPSGLATVEVGLLLSASLGDSLLVDGPPATFSTSRVGQDGYYTFEAGVGSNLTLVLAGNTFATNTLVRVLRPDGTQLATQSIGSSSGYTLDFTPTTTGLHAITVDPYLASTGQMTLQLVEEVNGSAGVPDGAATTVSLGAGQKGRYAFNGTAGDRLGLGVTSVAISPSSNNVAISILKPDGTSLVSCGNFTAPGDCDLPALPVTGTYFVTVNPSGLATVEVGLLLSTSLGDSLLVDGPPATFSTSRVGQDGYYTFEAGVGSNLTLVLAGNTFATNTLVRVLRPDGTQLATQSIGSSSGYTLDFTPTTTGLHAITVDPYLASTGQMTLQLVEEVNGSAGVPDSAATTVSLGAGQKGRYAFNGTAGDRLGLGVTSVAISPSSNNVAISILKPDGTSLVSCGNFTAPGDCDLPALPVTGTYFVTVNPSGLATVEVGLLLSTSLGDSLLVDGPPATFSTSRVGQDGYYTFEAGVGSNLTLVLAGNTFVTNTLVRVLRPDGTQLATRTLGSSSGYTLDFTPTTTGLHAITVDPYLASTGQISLRVQTQSAPFAPSHVGGQ
ncbi:IPT/TIG domain-containing protein [Myxococcus sp. NMCA1]|uniref:IPT/TIG domain-containing protein n=1 Tax=Myxococcus sp. NMCA1 TaxID=2996785 RepID=UPI002285978F|nr:IPT/TIG domain-containing protein [Myxococcus sp. NMCA1]WAM28257.1 IPT/TIG domain-containing protein [Myxococcus sp. NMCA1]